jgi:hypothetical protein
MREIQLTQGYVALVDDGDFVRVSAYKWHAHVERQNVYACRNIQRPDGKRTIQKLHNLIMDATGIDHADGNGLNCQRYNLRQATPLQNNHNTRAHSDNASGFKGVVKHPPNRWRARICIEGKSIHLGTFLDIQDAANAYDAAALQYFGDFALTNKTLKQRKTS